MQYVRMYDPVNITPGGWIGYDLDGSYARYDPGNFDPDVIGEPIPLSVARIKRHLSEGIQVKIVTARVAVDYENLQHESPERFCIGLNNPQCELCHQIEHASTARRLIQAHTKEHIGVALPVTASKDYNMIQLYDDRAVGLVANTGELACEYKAELPPPPGYGPENVG